MKKSYHFISKILIFYKGTVSDLPRSNEHNFLISRQGLLAINMELLQNPFMTSRLLKQKLKLIASIQTLMKNIKLLGWMKVRSSYCQIVSFNNQVKRYIFCCLCKLFSKKTTETLFLRIACSNSQKYNAWLGTFIAYT